MLFLITTACFFIYFATVREILTLSVRFGLLAGGILLFYASLSYETEEGKIQNLLEEWWIKVDDYQRQVLSKHIAFLKTLASVSTRLLDELFGPSLISVQSIGVSLCLCSVCIGVMSLIVERIVPHKDLSVSSSLWMVLSGGIYGIIPAFLQHISRKWLRVGSIYVWFIVLIVSQLWGFNLVAFLIMFLALLDRDPKMRLGAAVILGFFAILLAGIALFVLLVALMRKTVRSISNSSSAMRIVGLSALNIVPPSLLIVIIIGGIEIPSSRLAVVAIAAILILFGIFALVINFPFVLSALMFVLIAVTMVVHRLFWPAISRPLYKLQAMGIARRPMLFRGISIVLISASIGWHEWIWFIASKL